MKFKIIIILIIGLFFSCKRKKKQPKKIEEAITSKTVEKREKYRNSKEYFYTVANRLSLRKKPSLDAKRMAVLKYLEPLEIIECFPNKKETISDKKDGIIKGNWCKVRLLNGIEGYAFNGYIKSFEELPQKLNPKGIEPNELLINGKLKTTTSLKYFLDIIGKPDSIMSYELSKKNDFSDKIEREDRDGILYIIQNINAFTDANNGDFLDAGYGGWVYNNVRMKYFYKNGIEYEELNGEVSFSNIDLAINNNFITYNGFKIDSSSTLSIIEKLFPVQSRNNDQLQYDSKILYEFGNIREKKISNEIYYQLHCLQKAKSFNVYWYD